MRAGSKEINILQPAWQKFEKEGKWGGEGGGGAGVARKRIGAREEGAPRVYLAPKSPCPFPFKRLLRRLNIL